MERTEGVVLDSRGIHLPAGAGQLLSLIATRKGISRTELERLAGVSRATVVQRLGVLFASNLVLETDETLPSGGRPSKLLSINENFGLVLAVDIGESSTRVAITDLAPTILGERTFPTHLDYAPEAVLAEIKVHGLDLLGELGRSIQEVLGIGLSLPAPVDYENARVVGPSVMRGWDDFDIRAWFWSNLKLEAFADNDVNLMAIAEHRHYWPDEDYFFFVKAGTGIGSGIVTKGQVFRGGQGTAGDIGHIQLDSPHPPLCRCGKMGCVEAYAAGWAIARDLREKGFEADNARDVIKILELNTPECIQLVRSAGRSIGEAVADVVSILNPNLIVIGGTLAKSDEHLLSGIRELVNQRCLPLATKNLRIEMARLGDRAGVLGAAQLVIDERLHNTSP